MTDTTTHQTAVEHRLSRLPAKTATPFRQLLKAGLIREEAVDAILDAGDLAGDAGKLLGFATAYHYMLLLSVPIRDTIAMAKAHKRRINLGWSPNRWKDEHQRLSQAEALKRLAAENVRYDVRKFSRHLPKSFVGYLIRSSRRLGMEGARQRHCVASYHERIKAGSCAIAAVFVDKQRWTVELCLTGERKTPLRIAQIKTRCNGLPPASIRQRIHHMLGIPMPKAPAVQQSEGRHLYMENLRRLLPVLRDAGILTVTVEFDGSGDNGSVQDISYHPSDNPDVKNIRIEHLLTEGSFTDGRWTTTLRREEARVDDVIDALTYDYLDETGVDWCNNDGGFGRLHIDIGAGSVSLEVNQRYTESTCEFDNFRDIETGEVVLPP